MTRKIIKEDFERWKDHRGDFETCPSCGKKRGIEFWKNSAHTLCLKPQHGKADSVMVISSCNTCSEDSWVHEPMSSFHDYCDYWPKKWKAAVQKYEAQVMLEALRDWCRSVCGICARLTSGTVKYHAWRHCEIGSGPAEIYCEKFKELKRKKG